MLLAASGLLLVLFLAVHLAGVGLALVDQQVFEAWSASLHSWWPLPLLEAALVALFLLHPLKAVAKAWANAAAAPRVQAGRRSRRGGGLEALAALAARTSPWSGALLLLFLVVHLAQLRWVRPRRWRTGGRQGGVGPAPRVGPLRHCGAGAGPASVSGVESGHRSLGLLAGANAGLLRWLGRLVAVLLGVVSAW